MATFLTLLVALLSLPPAAPSGPPNGGACNYPARVLHSGPAFVPANIAASRPVVLDVTVDSAGSFLSAKIVTAAVQDFLNKAALQTARDADYAPGARNCKLIGGTVRLTVNFQNKDFNCDRDVTIVTEVVPAAPRDAWIGQPPGTEKTAVVQVTVGADGKLAGEKIVQSTGVMAMDQAALMAAQHSTYLPKMVNCLAVPADALFKVSFLRNQ